MDETGSLPLSEKEFLRQREIDAQLAGLRSPAPNARAASARRLGDLQAGLDELLEALQDHAEGVRAAAAMALGSFESSPRLAEIIETLLAAIDDASEKVCQNAIRSLGMLHAVSARQEIEDFLDDANPFIHGAAVLSLARLGAADLAPRLAGYLSHESAYVRMQAARAVAILNYQPAGDEIVRLLEKTRADRVAEGFSDPAARMDRREEDLYNLQNQLIHAAGELRLEKAVSILTDIAQKDIGFRGLAIEALVAIGSEIDVQLLSGLLADPSVYLRKRLILLIMQYNYHPALPLLRPLIREENMTIRVAALQAITHMRDESSLPRIRWMCYHDSNPFIRVQALQSLVTLQGQQALPHVLALAGDANYQLRKTAVEALLAWDLPGEASLRAAACFASDFAEDPLSAELQDALASRGFSAGCDERLPAPALPVIPESVQPQAADLLALLRQWQEAIRSEPTPTRMELEAALALLVEALEKEG